MQVLAYSEFADRTGMRSICPRPPEFFRDLAVEYAVGVSHNYHSKLLADYLEQYLPHRVNVLYAALDEEFTGKRVLDLHCGDGVKGSSGSFPGGFPGQFEPWLCRALVKLGAKPVGVDLGELVGEPFEYLAADLCVPRSLDFLADSSADVATAAHLFTSPRVIMNFGPQKLRSLLWPQLGRIVKPDGYFLINDEVLVIDEA